MSEQPPKSLAVTCCSVCRTPVEEGCSCRTWWRVTMAVYVVASLGVVAGTLWLSWLVLTGAGGG